MGTRQKSALPARQVRAIARVLADSNRYRILKMVAAEPCKSCADLRGAFEITAPTLSHHLKELESAGLIEITRRGKFVDVSFCREVWDAYLAELSQF